MRDLKNMLDKKFETWAVADLPGAPVDALQGVSVSDAEALKQSLNIRTIQDLAENRFVLAAQHILDLAADGEPAMTDQRAFEEMLARATSEFGLPNLTVDISCAQVAEQEEAYEGQRSFGQALNLALKSLLNDGSNIESPRSIVENEWGSDGLDERLLGFLNDDTAVLCLVHEDERSETDAGHRVYPPEGGEKLNDNWLFYLRIPSLSDHMFWAVVSRNDGGRVYNYGFN